MGGYLVPKYLFEGENKTELSQDFQIAYGDNTLYNYVKFLA